MAAVRVAEALLERDDVTLVGVAGRHPSLPAAPWTPPIPVHGLPLRQPFLYDAWLRLRWPRVESVTGPVDVVHSTTLIPAATAAPHVVTLHDLAWRHDPAQFTRRGVSVFERSLRRIIASADLVLCSSLATMEDAVAAGVPSARLRHVPLGVEPASSPHNAANTTAAAIAAVRARYALDGDYLLFVGTVEPRKNLARLVQALDVVTPSLPLVVVGAEGWGEAPAAEGRDVRFLGFVSEADKTALYAGAAVFCYPSEREGFGMPVLEAMAVGAPVVTSRGTSTEEVAGGAAVLVDPFDVADIGRGVCEALDRRVELAELGRTRAAACTWAATAAATVAAYRELA